MTNEKTLAEELTDLVEERTRHLPDEEYVECLDEISCNLDASVEAKRYELRRQG